MSGKQIASAPEEEEFSTLKLQPSRVSSYLRQIKDKRLALFKDRPAHAFSVTARLFGPRTLIRTACVHWSVLLCVVMTVVDVAVIEEFLGEDDELRETLTNSSSGVAILGGLLSFVLVFRTNVCYSRWWEGRCLWGGAIFSTIHICQQGCAWISDARLRRRLVHTVVVFAWASKAMLRGNFLEDEVEEGRALVERGLLDQEELDEIARCIGWQPYYVLDVRPLPALPPVACIPSRAAVDLDPPFPLVRATGNPACDRRGATARGWHVGVGRWVPLRSHDGFRGLDQSARSQCRWWDPRQGDRTPNLVSEKRVELHALSLSSRTPARHTSGTARAGTMTSCSS